MKKSGGGRGGDKEYHSCISMASEHSLPLKYSNHPSIHLTENTRYWRTLTLPTADLVMALTSFYLPIIT